MPRLESLSKGGYYPTPPRVTAALARRLAAPAGGGKLAVRALDPCCGTGAALATLGAALGAETYGIELHAGRAEEARATLDHVLATDAFAIRAANQSMSLMLLNPPYDASADADRRMEHAFLTGMTRLLAPDGLLIFIVPQRRLGISARYLASNYAGHAIYRFPDPEWAAFNQVVLLARRTADSRQDRETEARIAAWATDPLDPLPDAPSIGTQPYRVPALPRAPILFAGLLFDPTAAAAEARRAGVWGNAALAEQLWPVADRVVRPLMPLRRGHLGQLIAAGFINNHILELGDERLIVKGRTVKELVVVHEDDTQLVEKEVSRTSIMTLDLRTGELTTIGHRTEPAARAPADR